MQLYLSLFFSILLFSTGLFSQSPDSTTITFGIFEIGKSDTSIITVLSKELGKPYTTAITCDPLEGQPNYFVEFISDSNDMNHQCIGYVVPGVRSFCLAAYSTDGLELKSLSFTFYNNTLVELRCDMSPAIEKAMDIRYESHSTSKENAPWPCHGEDNETVTITTTKQTQIWTVTKDKKAIYSELQPMPLPGNCEIISSQTFYIRDLKKIGQLNQIQTEMQLRFFRRAK